MGKERNDVTLHIGTGTIIKVIVISVLFVVLFLLRDLVLVVLAAIVVASSIEPITRWFVSRKIPRLPSVMLIYFSLALIFIGGFYFLILPLLNDSSSFLSSLPQYINQGSESIRGSSFVQSEPIFQQISSGVSLGNFAEHGNKILASLSAGFWNTVSVVFGSLLSFVLIIVLSFYLAVQENGVGKFLKIISSRRYENYITDLWKRSEIKIGLWMQGQLLLVVIIGVIVYLGLALFGVRHALLLAVLAGVFELIPLFGPILAAIPAILIGFVDGGLSMGLIIAGFYLVVQQFENQLIYPLVVKKVVGVSPIIVIIALVAGAQLAGFLGMLLSVPLAAIIMEFVNDLEHDKTSSQ
ncbi:MAG: AI-2E family transporter [Candidatus Paceibacterota bacterium]